MEELNPEQIASESAPENVTAEPSEPQDTPVQETAETPPPKLNRMKIVSAVFNGFGIGFLLGILWSLNTEPAIGGVIATLSSLLALFLGLNEKYIDTLKSLRIGSFGLAAVLGIMLGLYLRANDPFAPSLKAQMDQYLEIGYDENEARGFITKVILADSTKAKRQSAELFSATVELSDCMNLRDIDNTWTMANLRNLKLGLSETWLEFLEEFEKEFEEEQVVTAMITMRKCFCPEEGGSGSVEIESSDKIKELGQNNSVEEIEDILSSSDSGHDWQKIVEEVSRNFDGEQKKKMYITAIKVLTHE